MVQFELAKGYYPSSEQLIRLIYFIRKPEACRLQIGGGLNIESSIFTDPEYIIEQFLETQEGKQYRRKLYHLTIWFEGRDITDFDFAYWAAGEICRIYPDYQSVFTVQDNHVVGPEVHIVFNNYPINRCHPQLAKVFDIQFIIGRVGHMVNKFQMNPIQQIYVQEDALEEVDFSKWRWR